MDFEIKSLVGAGPIQFGMTQQEVRSSLQGPIRSFKRTPSEALPSDHFTDLGIIVYYKVPGIVEAIEFSRPSAPIYFGVRLFEQTVDQVKSLLTSKDSNLEIDSDGFVSRVMGLGFYVIDADPENEIPPQILSAIAFEKSYYD